MWGFSLLDSLLEEYSFQYGKIHKTADLRESCRCYRKILQGPLTPFAVAMPDDCKMPDAISAYRLYYKKYKSDFAVWTKRPAPIWFIENHVVSLQNNMSMNDISFLKRKNNDLKRSNCS
jgi:hypothetical protein